MLDVAMAGIAARIATGVVKTFADQVKFERPDPVRLGRKLLAVEGPPRPI